MIFRTCCASPAAPLGDFCTELSHTRVASAGPRGDFVLVECRRPSARSFFEAGFCGGFFACILHDSASLKSSPPRRKRVRAGTRLFLANYKGRISPDESSKKFAKVVDVPGVLQVLAVRRCEPVGAGGKLLS